MEGGVNRGALEHHVLDLTQVGAIEDDVGTFDFERLRIRTGSRSSRSQHAAGGAWRRGPDGALEQARGDGLAVGHSEAIQIVPVQHRARTSWVIM